MSWFDDIIDLGSSAFDWATGSSTSAGLTRAAGLAYLLNELNSNNTKNDPLTKVDVVKTKYSREQVDPSTENAIPVVYGDAFVGGLINDAVLSEDNQTMWYCLTLCEKTGTLFSNGQDSKITFKRIYWNDNEVVLQSDGKTAGKLVNIDGVESTDINGLAEFYLYNNGSNSPTQLLGHSYTPPSATTLFPNWTSNHTMDKLVFAIVKVTYNAEKSITGLGKLQFQLSNTLKQPGDVLYDYMLNTRYGAGINASEIYST